MSFKLNFKYLTIIFLLFIKFSYVTSKQKAFIYMQEVKNLKKNEFQNELQNFSVELVGPGRYVLSGYILVKYDQPEIKHGYIKLTRCRSAVDMESCELFMNIKFTGACEKMKLKNQIWSPLIDALKPKFDCRIKKKLYSFRLEPIEATMAIQIVPDAVRSFWMGEFCVFHEKNVEVVCGIAKGKILIVKN